MEITIKKVYEHMGQLRVLVDHEYGEENIGLSLKAKKLDPETGEPRWKNEVKELLQAKYGLADKKKKIPKVEHKEFEGQKFVVGE